MKYISSALFIIGFIVASVGLITTILGAISTIWLMTIGATSMFLGNAIEELDIWL